MTANESELRVRRKVDRYFATDNGGRTIVQWAELMSALVDDVHEFIINKPTILPDPDEEVILGWLSGVHGSNEIARRMNERSLVR